MPLLVLDPAEERELLCERRKFGRDRYDEVWDGVYVMAPNANTEHSYFVANLILAIGKGIEQPGAGQIHGACNVSDRKTGWAKNYRCPDLAVFLAGNPAQDCGTHWFGGPDFAVEIVSPKDRSRDKLDFYFRVGVRELLIVDRKPWRVELYRNDGATLALVGSCPAKKPKALASLVIPFRFTLADGLPRPHLLVTRTADGVATRI